MESAFHSMNSTNAKGTFASETNDTGILRGIRILLPLTGYKKNYLHVESKGWNASSVCWCFIHNAGDFLDAACFHFLTTTFKVSTKFTKFQLQTFSSMMVLLNFKYICHRTKTLTQWYSFIQRSSNTFNLFKHNLVSLWKNSRATGHILKHEYWKSSRG